MRLWRRRNPVSTFACASAVVAIAVAYGGFARDRSFPDRLRYLPAEHRHFFALGDAASVWRMLDRHLGPVMRGSEEDGALETRLRRHADALRDADVSIRDAADLQRHGIDIGDGVFLVAADRSNDRAVIVLPITDAQAVTAFLERRAGEAPVDTDVPRADGVVRLPRIGRWVVAVPEPGVAVLATDGEDMARALDNGERNLRRFRTNDALYSGIRRLLGGRAGNGPTLHYFADVPSRFVRDFSAAARLVDDRAEVAFEVRLRTGRLRLLEDVFARAPALVAWRRLLPRDTAIAIAIEDRQASRYLALLGDTEFGADIKTRYGGVLWEMRRVAGLERLVLAVTGYRAGLPELVLGIWGDPEAIRVVLQDVRGNLRASRDRALASAAAERGVPAPASEPADYRGPAYVHQYHNVEIAYLLPPVTDDDLALRNEFADVDPALARQDRFRLASARAHGAWWIATDADTLYRLIDGFGPGDSFDANPAGGAPEWQRSGGDKFQAMLDLDQVAAIGALSPESGVHEGVRRYLLDFRHHPVITLRAGPARDATIRGRLEITRRPGLP